MVKYRYARPMRVASVCCRRLIQMLVILVAAARATAAQSLPEATVSALVDRSAPDEVTVRAVRLDSPLTLDGRLEEAVYGAIAPITDFIQQEPREGQPATEKTEAWILFDDVNLYICARNWDSHPEREVANELRRDNGNILGNENLTFVHRHVARSPQRLSVPDQPLGALRDMAVTDDQQNQAWNGIWDVKTGAVRARLDGRGGDPVQVARYRGSGPQTWGINLRRLVKWKNEFSYLSLVPAALGTGGVEPHGVGRDAGRPRDAARSRRTSS